MSHTTVTRLSALGSNKYTEELLTAVTLDPSIFFEVTEGI